MGSALKAGIVTRNYFSFQEVWTSLSLSYWFAIEVSTGLSISSIIPEEEQVIT